MTLFPQVYHAAPLHCLLMQNACNRFTEITEIFETHLLYIFHAATIYTFCPCNLSHISISTITSNISSAIFIC